MSVDHVRIELDNPYVSWQTARGAQGDKEIQAWVRGYAWVDGQYQPSEDLAAWWCRRLCSSSKEITETLEHHLRQTNGSFALVTRTSNCVAAAVDRLRSIPLFYGTDGEDFLIADSADRVRHFCGDTQLDEASVTEFLLARYVTGCNTLSPSVKQIQAGELITVNVKEDPAPEPRRLRYYRFTHGDHFDQSKEDLYAAMEDVYDRVFRRLVRSVQGRRLIVPLSGGLDSRSIVVSLRRLGVEDVLCFSYGPPGNWESEISCEVATRLGYSWHFVPSTRRRWRKWFRSEECQTYHLYGSGLTSLAHLQDWPAVWEMKKSGVLKDGDVIVPGHTGDFISGGHIPSGIARQGSILWKDLVRAIARKHYTLWNWKETSPETIAFIAEHVASLLSQTESYSSDAAAGAFELWEWQERQAKYIVNSVRGYEYWGFEWRTPLWDSEWMDFWSSVPLSLRINKRLYDSYLTDMLFPKYGVASLRYNESTKPRTRITTLVAKMTNPRLGRYHVRDYVDTWQRYGERFGHTQRSTFYLLNTATLNVSMFLSRLTGREAKRLYNYREIIKKEGT